MTTGEKISKLRRDNNYTQEQLAELLGVSRQAISKWESSLAYPETDKLIRLGELFDCSLDYLLKDSVEDRVAIKDSFDSSRAVNIYPEPTVDDSPLNSGQLGQCCRLQYKYTRWEASRKKKCKNLSRSATVAYRQKRKRHSGSRHKRHRSYCYRL